MSAACKSYSQSQNCNHNANSNLGLDSCAAVGVGHTEGIGAVAFNRSGGRAAFVVSGSNDKTVKIWDCAAALASWRIGARNEGGDEEDGEGSKVS